MATYEQGGGVAACKKARAIMAVLMQFSTKKEVGLPPSDMVTATAMGEGDSSQGWARNLNCPPRTRVSIPSTEAVLQQKKKNLPDSRAVQKNPTD